MRLANEEWANVDFPGDFSLATELPLTQLVIEKYSCIGKSRQPRAVFRNSSLHTAFGGSPADNQLCQSF